MPVIASCRSVRPVHYIDTVTFASQLQHWPKDPNTPDEQTYRMLQSYQDLSATRKATL